MIAVPRGNRKDYVKLLARVVIFAKNEENFRHLLNDTPEELMEYLDRE